MPDELAQAHAARLARLNGLTSIMAMVAEVRRDAIPDSQETVEVLLRLLARAEGCSPDVYCQRHSLYPYRRIVSALGEAQFLEAQRGSFIHPRYRSHDTMRFCAKCAAADLAQHGFSWYRRRHDIPGIDRCIVHGTALWEARYEQIDSRFPHEYLARKEAVEVDGGKVPGASALIRHYVEAFLALGSLGTPLAKSSVSVAIAQRSARLLGGASTTRLTRMALNKMVVAKVPANWLRRFANEDELATGLAAIQNRHDVANEYVAIAIASLYPSPADAIRDFRRTQVAPEFSAVGSKRGSTVRRLVRDPTWPAYSRNAAWLGYLASAVSSRNAEGVEWDVLPKLAGLDQSSAWRAMKTFCEGGGLRDACAMHSADLAEVERFLRVEARVFVRFIDKLQAMNAAEFSAALPRGAEDGQQRTMQSTELDRLLGREELWLNSTEAGLRLNPGAVNPKGKVRQALQNGRVIGVWDGAHTRYPAFQFLEGGGLHPRLDVLMSVLPCDKSGKVSRLATRWALTPNEGLAGSTPADVFAVNAEVAIHVARKSFGKR
jgi:hypothetical protein